MKIATFNANSIRMRLGTVLGWLATEKPDVLCLQETKVQDSEFPKDAFAGTGYHVAFRGMKSYNGVALLSRREPESVSFGLNDGSTGHGPETGISYAQADEARFCHSVIQGVSILNTYVPQGHEIDSPKYAYKLEWFNRLHRYFKKHSRPGDPVIWCGDMNVAPRDMDIHSPEKHLKHVCFHEDVRKAYMDTISWGFTDVFTKLHPDKQQFTFWDYRQPSSFIANRGWRIDHILATTPLAEGCRRVEVDMAPRGQPQSSDHTFLWAEFHL